MKRHFLAIGAITITTLLAGCDFGDLVGQHQSDKQSENSMLVNNGRQENKSRKIPKLRWFLFARYTLT